MRGAEATFADGVLLALSVLYIVAAAFVRWPALLHPHFASSSTADSALFGLIGEMTRHGAKPYIGFWDHTPPLIYILDGVALTASRGTVVGLWVATVVALLATLGMTWLAWRPIAGPTAAAVAVVWVSISIGLAAPFNLPEGFALPAQAATVLVVSRWASGERGTFSSTLIAGALLGCAVLLRPNLIGTPLLVMVAIPIALVGARRIDEVLSWFGGALVGLALGLGPVLLWLGAHGALRPFWNEVFRYNVEHSSASLHSWVRAAFDGLTTTPLSALLLLPLIGWLIAAQRLLTRRSGVVPRPALVFTVVWAPIEIALGASPARPALYHFTLALLPLGALTAIAMAEGFGVAGRLLSPIATRSWTRDVGLTVCLAIAIVPIGRTVLDLRDRGLIGDRARQVDATVEYVRNHTSSENALLVWGAAPDVYFFAGRQPASHFVTPQALVTPRYADSALVASFIADVQSSAPPIIVDASNGGPPSEPLVPPLSVWNARWQYPESGVARWSMTPSLRAFYDLVANDYAASDTIGPMRWIVYTRR